jgi:hypothetical protein
LAIHVGFGLNEVLDAVEFALVAGNHEARVAKLQQQHKQTIAFDALHLVRWISCVLFAVVGQAM